MALNDELYRIYIAAIYPVLASNDPVYQRSLAKAGLGWAVTAVPSDHMASFADEMKMQAWLAAKRVEDARSLAPGTIRTKVLKGPQTLYRVASRSSSKANPGIWWFSEKVAQRCRDAAGADPSARLNWLRNVLAVCYNWSTFDRIERLALHGNEEIPAILGVGLPMPHDKLVPFIDSTTGTRVVKMPPDYWKNMGRTLLGGESQIVLPWIPVRRVSATPSL